MDTMKPKTPEASPESEKPPRYRLMITRHAERLPSGQLSPEGIESAKRKGRAVASAEVIKGYASDHPSKRAFETVDMLSSESGVVSAATKKQYTTRSVSDIQYAVLDPDFSWVLTQASDRIDEATLRELGMSTERDEKGKLKVNIKKLPPEEQARIAPIRANNQKVGFDYTMKIPEVLHRMAIGLAQEVANKLRLLGRYDRARRGAQKPPTRDVVLTEGTHGMFMESLLREAGVLRRSDGTEVHGIQDFSDSEFGGYIQPLESIVLEVEDPQHVPDLIPVTFEGANRPKPGSVCLDRSKLETLADEYKKWKASSEKQS